MSRLLDVAGARTYAGAGVSIEAGDEAVERMKKSVDSTFREGVLGGIGGFGGLFALGEKYKEPVLVASADGVGTKLEVARLLGRYDTVGIDLVAMLVDDLVCVGAEPLFVLDYLAVGSLNPQVVEVRRRGHRRRMPSGARGTARGRDGRARRRHEARRSRCRGFRARRRRTR